MAAAISTHGLMKSFGATLELRGLDLTVAPGSFYGFLGPNGAGKSTTIHILTGLLESGAGTVEVLGMPVPERMPAIKRSIAVVPDESVLFDRLTGLEFLDFVARMYGLPRNVAADRSRESMGLFELEGTKSTLIASYSKGMKKRVALAAALIHRPKLFLLDEPFEGVDPVGSWLMKEILMQQVAQGATVFLTSHVIEVVERLCDRVSIIDHGQVVLEGTVTELREAEETLEDTFVRVVGGERELVKLDWL